ncbi:hypothetical protein [Pararhizobium arenae]|uniref:hypothetical protein n=1 Tax=Pararhizobium arenae TaxID=1856850 RepID=UPI00094B476E|nr:hypothetical protein [Pararhizobium arenae]
MPEEIDTTGAWYKIGFDEGAKAGTSDMVAERDTFSAMEDALAMGHAVLDGRYATIRRRQIDFQSFDDIQDWMGGVLAGTASVGARIGFQVSLEYPYSSSDGGVVTYILVVRDSSTVSH